jgi:hypothetical protein
MIVRWHDAGDFFSPDYFDIAIKLAKEFPDVRFYGYSKVAASFATSVDNLIMNFSEDAHMDEKQQVDILKTKVSITLPNYSEAELDQYMDYKQAMKDGKPLVDKKTGKPIMQWQWTDFEGFKDLIMAKYDRGNQMRRPFAKGSVHGDQYLDFDRDSLITYDELEKIPESSKNAFRYNVVVRPAGDGDDSASRKDVWITFLMRH